jgi:hypothetical protein
VVGVEIGYTEGSDLCKNVSVRIKTIMSRFYHLYLVPKKGMDPAEVSKLIVSSTECCQYDSQNWVIHTTFDAKEWYTRLQRFVEPGGKLFICELNLTDYWGLMNNNLWKMMRKGQQGLVKGVPNGTPLSTLERRPG